MEHQLPDGRTLSYARHGAGRPVVLLHPVGLQHGFWAGVASHLGRHALVITPDLPGHGASSRCSTPFTLASLADDIIDLLRASQLGPALIGGCSMGGMIAQHIALAAPDCVAGLVLTNTAHTLPAAGRAAMRARGDAARAGGMAAVLDATLERWFSTDWRTRHPQAVAHIATMLLACDAETFALSWAAIAALDTLPRLHEIKVPVWIGTGSADVSTPPASAQALCDAFNRASPDAANAPQATLHTFADAGHLTPYEQAAAFAAAMIDFMQRCPRLQEES